MPAARRSTESAHELIDERTQKSPMSPRPHERTAAFPSTRWSRILAQGGPRDLEALARTYWRPIQAYLGARLRRADDDAADLAQDAFAWMLATRFFERADPARGRFRGLLKTALSRFAIEQLRREGADKRGGGRVHEALAAGHERADPQCRTPEQALDDAWRRELLEHALRQLEDELSAGGRRAYFQVFRDYFLADDGSPDYAALAARHGISTTDVSNWLGYAKRRYRARLRALVLETVAGEDEQQEELRWLFGPAARGAGRP
jgi:RNA polymerase sigma-70 factor (ECF subfamily)